jgi:cell pole-organizing protein PopZ
MVTFGDVNLQSAPIGGPYQAGAGGWPTVRYFNKETGENGAPYKKKTSKAMCDELGDDSYMSAYVTESGSTSTCSLADESTCTEKERDFASKWSDKSAADLEAQTTRLRGMSAGSMKPELRAWLGQRLNVLVQLAEKAAASKEEL